MAVKRYNGTSWDTVAGLGAQGAAATSSSITTWVKTASGGETSLTGSSDSSTTLAYTPGQEQVFINGVLQVRGSDYTATNGTSITGLAALTAGDIATVTTVNAFSVTGAVPLSTVTANGDLIVGTSAGAVGRLGIGSTGNLLTVSGGVPTWAAPANSGGMTVLASGSLSGASLDLTSINQTYVDLVLVLLGYAPATNTGYGQLRFNNDSNTRYTQSSENNPASFNTFGAPRIDLSDGMSNTATTQSSVIEIQNYANTSIWKRCTTDTIYTSTADGANTKWRRSFYYGIYNQATAIDRITVTPSGGFVSQGTYVLYGVK